MAYLLGSAALITWITPRPRLIAALDDLDRDLLKQTKYYLIIYAPRLLTLQSLFTVVLLQSRLSAPTSTPFLFAPVDVIVGSLASFYRHVSAYILSRGLRRG